MLIACLPACLSIVIVLTALCLLIRIMQQRGFEADVAVQPHWSMSLGLLPS